MQALQLPKPINKYRQSNGDITSACFAKSKTPQTPKNKSFKRKKTGIKANKIKMKSILSDLKIITKNKGVSTGVEWLNAQGEKIESFSPVDGKRLASVYSCDKEQYEAVIQKA